MKYVWVKCYKDMDMIKPDPLLLEAIDLLTPFPKYKDLDKVFGKECSNNEGNFVLKINDECIGNSCQYYSKSVLYWNIKGSWEDLAHVCVIHDNREIRRKQAYNQLIQLLSSSDMINHWIKENWINNYIPVVNVYEPH